MVACNCPFTGRFSDRCSAMGSLTKLSDGHISLDFSGWYKLGCWVRAWIIPDQNLFWHIDRWPGWLCPFWRHSCCHSMADIAPGNSPYLVLDFGKRDWVDVRFLSRSTCTEFVWQRSCHSPPGEHIRYL